MTWHVAVPTAAPADKAQLAETGLKVPVELVVKLTEPDGVLAGLVVSETVAVQVEVPPTLIEVGAQETTVDVLSSWAALTVILAEVPELPL